MSQAGILDVINSNPSIPTQFNGDSGNAIPIGNELDMQGQTVANATHSKPVFITASGMTVTTNVQVGAAITGAPVDNNDAGLVSFDDTMFTVDEFGFVQLIGGGAGIDSINVDTATAPGTDPVTPNGAGMITVTGAQVASGTVGANVIRTDSLAANTYTIEIQRATAAASPTLAANGVSHFDSNIFTVDGSGFVTASGTGLGQTITGNDGTPIAPVAGNWDLVTAHSTPVFEGTAGTETLDFGIDNLALGSSLPTLTTAVQNVAYGLDALNALTDGQRNTAMGWHAGLLCDEGGNNTFVGFDSGADVTDAELNTFVGSISGHNVTTGDGNTAVGYGALQTLTTGSYNIVIGSGAANGSNLATSASSNIVIGNDALGGDNNKIKIGTQGNGNGQQNECYIAGIDGVNVGNVASVVTIASSGGQLGEAVITAGTGITVTPTANVITVAASGAVGQTITGNSGGAIAPSSGNWNLVTSNSTVTFAGSGSTLTQNFGLSNLLLGATGTSIAGAANNTAVGLNALLALTSGQENCAYGVNCLDSLLSGSNNCGYGVANLAALTTSGNNACFGHNSGQLISTGSGGNSACGYQSLSQVTTGSFNTAIGYQAGRGYTGTEANNISIGNGVLGTAAESNTTRIGSTQTRFFGAGITGVTVASSQPVGVDSNGQLSSLSTVINVSSAGEVTKPLQPAFLANLGSNDANVTGNGTTYTLGGPTALTEIFDQNADFNTNGTFTAPVTGKYHLTFQIRISGVAAATTTLPKIVTSNRTYTYSTAISGEASLCSNTSALCDMDAADTATFTTVVNGLGVDTATVVGNAAPFTYVCGYLAC